MEIQTPKELHPFVFYIKPKSPNEKIVIKLDKWNVHYTIQFGLHSKKLNVHRTTEIKGSTRKKYLDILTIRHFTIGRILVYFKYNHPILYKKYFFFQTINKGKLIHHNCILLPLECNKDNFADLFSIEKNKFRFSKKWNAPKIEDIFLMPDYIDECCSQSFYLYKMVHGNLRFQGFVYKKPQNPNSRKYFFCSKSNLNSFLKEQALLLYNILKIVNFKGKDTIIKDMEKRINELYPMMSNSKAI